MWKDYSHSTGETAEPAGVGRYMGGPHACDFPRSLDQLWSKREDLRLCKITPLKITPRSGRRSAG